MKAWQDIKRTCTVYDAENYQWYVDRGISIRYYEDEDRYEVYNTMTLSDHYELVPDDVLKVFQEDGWDIGTYVMNIRVLQSRLDRIDRSLAYPRITEESMGRFLEEREKVINKMQDYEQRLVSLNPLKFKFNHYDTLERDVQGQ